MRDTFLIGDAPGFVTLGGMGQPRYTIIVPMPLFSADEPVLVSLRNAFGAGGDLQIIVAAGRHPARQRNAAMAKAIGEIIVFLDNDCVVEPAFWIALDTDFAKPEVEVVGGPALLRSHATESERIFHALLTHPLVVGPIAARYAAQGDFRPSTQTELILCNLAARRDIFTRIGPLSTELYPNEENEWLDRAKAEGVGIYYDPALQVFRPQRTTWGEMARTLFRYGVGRSCQLRVSGWRPTAHQAIPLVLLLPLIAILLGPRYMLGFLATWLFVALLVAVTCHRNLCLGERILAGLIAPLVPLLYAVGQVAGWFTFSKATEFAPGEVALFNERGEPLP